RKCGSGSLRDEARPACRRALTKADTIVPCRLARVGQKRHCGLLWRAVALARIASHAGDDAVLPACRAAATYRDDVVDAQLLQSRPPTAVLALEGVAAVHIAPVECKLTPRHAVKAAQHQDFRDANHQVR